MPLFYYNGTALWTFPPFPSLRSGLHSWVLAICNVLKRTLEMLPRILETRRVVRGVEVGVDELDQAIKIFRRHLYDSPLASFFLY